VPPASARFRPGPAPKPQGPQRLCSWGPAAIMASSARRVFIGYLVLAKAAEA
jgi:hypothetical protein